MSVMGKHPVNYILPAPAAAPKLAAKKMLTDHSRYYFRLIEKFRGSGLTVKEFCAKNSLNSKVYYYWKKKYESQSGKGLTANRHGFLPVTVDVAPKAETGGITIHYADGTKLVFEQMVSPALIKTLLPAFGQ